MIAFTAANALEIGKAAEHLVCCDLILAGRRVFLTDQGLPYDVVIDDGGRLIRVQVKAATKPRNAHARSRNQRIAYVFHVRRVGREGRKRLTNADCDIVALVALDSRTVGYLPISAVSQTVAVNAPGAVFTGRRKKSGMREFADLTLEAALAAAVR